MIKTKLIKGKNRLAFLLLILCVLGLTILGVILLSELSYNDRQDTVFANTHDEVFTITYTLNDGALEEINKTEYTVSTETFTLNNPIKIGYDFTGWTGTDLDHLTKNVTISKGSTGNRSYTANYVATVYTISYNLMGGNLTSTNPKSYTIEDENFTLNNPSKKGYTFVGWTGTDVEETSQNVVVTKGSYGNRAYTANFDVIEYKISYELDGGSAENRSIYTIEDDFYLINPEKDDFTFTGWIGTNITSPLTSVRINKGSEGDLSFVAQFTRKRYSIDINYAGGTGSNASSYTSISEDIVLNNPIRLGYNFAGWIDKNENIFNQVEILTGSKVDLAYTALWTPIEYTIKLKIDDKEKEIKYTVESDDIIVENPAKKDYEFRGWTRDGLDLETNLVIKSGSMGNKEYTATWQKNNKKIIWIVSLSSIGSIGVLTGLFFLVRWHKRKRFKMLESI